MPTDPTNPSDDVSVNGSATIPLAGIVTLLAEIVKIGMAGTPAAPAVETIAESITSKRSALSLIM
jgi:hypothetical protein